MTKTTKKQEDDLARSGQSATAESDPRVEPVADTKPLRIWAVHCPFKKSGFPSLGTFGYTEKAVVILTMETWNQLCAEIPALKTRPFEVGSYD